MKLRFRTLEAEDVSITVSKSEYAQLLERFTVRGARSLAHCPLCTRYVAGLLKCGDCPLNLCLDMVPGLAHATYAVGRLWGSVVLARPQDVATLRNFRRFIRRAAERGRRK